MKIGTSLLSRHNIPVLVPACCMLYLCGCFTKKPLWLWRSKSICRVTITLSGAGYYILKSSMTSDTMRRSKLYHTQVATLPKLPLGYFEVILHTQQKVCHLSICSHSGRSTHCSRYSGPMTPADMSTFSCCLGHNMHPAQEQVYQLNRAKAP